MALNHLHIGPLHSTVSMATSTSRIVSFLTHLPARRWACASESSAIRTASAVVDLGFGRGKCLRCSWRSLESHFRFTGGPAHRSAGGNRHFRSSRSASEGVVLARASLAVDERSVDTINVIDVLEERGLIEFVSGDELRTACSKPGSNPVKVYCGFDPTAETLHLGNLLGIIVLSWFQRCGHIPVVLMGGATARVGDPSGKSVERPAVSEERASQNLTSIRSVFDQILRREDSLEKTHLPMFLNNSDWWRDFSLLDFLRDVAKHSKVGAMMAKESVKRRLESEEGVSYTEFTYQLLQGYDFVHLFREVGVTVQIGGSDQWGNITAGTDLVRKVLQEEGAHGLAWPLLLKSDGTKFGMSERGAVWLAASSLSPYKFYQTLFSTPDSDVIKMLKFLTFVDLNEIKTIEAGMGNPGYIPNSAQKRLAEEVTRFVHGEEALGDAQRATQALAPGSNTELDAKVLESIAEDVPSFSLPRTAVVGLSVVDLCVKTKLQASKGAARRLISQGGLYLNNKKVLDGAQTLDPMEFVDDKMLLLSAGKKNKLVVRLQ